MKLILQDNNYFVLRFDKGEELISALAVFMEAQKISACTFYGLGSALDAELAFYNSHLKQYRKKPFYDEMEIISLVGNGAVTEGKPAIHAHGTFSLNDFTVLGGHVFKLSVSATCEIHLTKLEGQMNREPNADLNLNLLV